MKRRLASSSHDLAGRVCYRCGAEDHQSNDCPLNNCYNCGQPGHRARDCPRIEAEQDNSGADQTLANFHKAQSWSVDQMFGGGSNARSRSNAVVNEKGASPVRDPERAPGTVESRFDPPSWIATRPKQIFARLKIFKGSELVDIVPMSKNPAYLLGRQKELVDVLLEHPTISRKHAAIVHHVNGSCHIIDLGSTGGTWVGPTRLAPHESRQLSEGITIVFGQSTRRYSMCFGMPDKSEVVHKQRSNRPQSSGRPSKEERAKKKQNAAAAMGSLLGGYGSDEDDHDSDDEAGNGGA